MKLSILLALPPYHSIPVDREDKAIWKHDLFRMTGDAYKNVGIG